MLPLSASATRVAPGGTVEISSSGAACYDEVGRPRLSLITGDGDGPTTWPRVEASGRFRQRITIPAGTPTGNLSVLLDGMPCRDTGASCPGQSVEVQVGG